MKRFKFYVLASLLALPSFAQSMSLSRPYQKQIVKQFEEGKAKIKFDWRDNSKAQFQLEFSLDSEFETVFLSKKITKLPYFWETDITGHVWWRVKKFDADKKLLETSDIRRFTISPPAPSIDLVELNGYQFSWDSTQKAEFYRFKIAKNKDFEPAIINTDLTKKNYPLESLKVGTYFWKVGAKFNRQIPINYSKVRKLVVKKGVIKKEKKTVKKPKFKKYKLSKVSKLKSSQKVYKMLGDKAHVDLSWAKVKNASSYQVRVGKKVDIVTLDTKIRLKLPRGKFAWDVRAVAVGGSFGPWSKLSSFEVTTAKQKLTLTDPDHKSKNDEFLVEFEWEAQDACSEYHLLVSSVDDFSYLTADKKTKKDSIEWDFEDEGTYFWYVKCLKDGKQIFASEVREINVYE